MTENKIIMGPVDNEKLPYESLGSIFYKAIKQKNPNTIILIDGETGDEINYGKLFECSIILANQLKELGVKKGDVITIVAQNSWKYVLTIISAFYIGAQVNLLNPDYTPGELKHFLSICRPILIFCSQKSLENILKLKDETCYPQNIVLFDGDAIDHMKTFDECIAKGEFNSEFTPTELNPEEDGALILTSSGTCGFPKCVLLTHKNIRVSLIYCGDPNFLDLNEKEIITGHLPFFHLLGNIITLCSIFHGTKLVILQTFEPEKFLKIIDNYKVTKLILIPSVLFFLLKNPMVNNYNISSVNDIVCGAAAVSKQLEKLAKIKLKIASIRQLYGLTETGGAVTMVQKGAKRIGSVGKITNTYQIKVCDLNTGEILPSNHNGELRIKGDGVMKSYLGNSEENELAFDDDGFLKSGDLGYYDDDGSFYIVGRLKELIKYNGFQVAPAELENLLIQHPAINDAAVIGKPHERTGEVPVAFVVKQPDKEITEEEIISYVAENVCTQKRIYGGVKFLDKIPKNPSGKILRRKLKELL